MATTNFTDYREADEVETMTWAFVEGDIREDQMLRLRTALIRSKPARQKFIEVMRLQSELVQMLGIVRPQRTNG